MRYHEHHSYLYLPNVSSLQVDNLRSGRCFLRNSSFFLFAEERHCSLLACTTDSRCNLCLILDLYLFGFRQWVSMKPLTRIKPWHRCCQFFCSRTCMIALVCSSGKDTFCDPAKLQECKHIAVFHPSRNLFQRVGVLSRSTLFDMCRILSPYSRVFSIFQALTFTLGTTMPGFWLPFYGTLWWSDTTLQWRLFEKVSAPNPWWPF